MIVPLDRFARASAVCLALLLAAAAPCLAQDGEPQVRSGDLPGITGKRAALLMGGQPGGELPLRVLTVPLVTGDASRLAVIVETPTAKLLPEDGTRVLQLEVFVYAVRSGGAVGASLAKAFEVRHDGTGALRPGVKFVGFLDLAPGSYSVRTMVQDSRAMAVAVRAEPVMAAISPKIAPAFITANGVLRLCA